MLFEKKIKTILRGETLKTALDFIAFLQVNDDFSAEPCEGTDGWNIYRKGINSAYVALDGDKNTLEIVLHINTYGGEEPADDGLKAFAWQHVVICPGCGRTTSCGETKFHNKIFEKEFERICQSPLYFPNPTADEMKKVQTLLLLLH